MFILYLLSSISISFSIDLQCSFNFSISYNFYSCYVENNLNINSTENIPIKLINATHLDFKDNTQVIGFYAFNKNIRYIPKNIVEIFGNLKIIKITYGRLKEIHQSDLQPFEQLEYCQLMDNDIEFLENGLFHYNLNLQQVSFKNNKIIHIGDGVFDQLGSLSWLNLEANGCINMKSENDTLMTKSVIDQAKFNCTAPAIQTVTEPTLPVTTEPVIPAVTNIVHSALTEPALPVTTEPALLATTEPVIPAPNDLTHLTLTEPAIPVSTTLGNFNESKNVYNMSQDIIAPKPKIGLLNFYKYPHEWPWWIIIAVILIHFIFGGIGWHLIRKYRSNPERDDTQELIDIWND